MSTLKKRLLKGLLYTILVLCPLGSASQVIASEQVKAQKVGTRFEFGINYGYPYGGYPGYPYGPGYYGPGVYPYSYNYYYPYPYPSPYPSPYPCPGCHR